MTNPKTFPSVEPPPHPESSQANPQPLQHGSQQIPSTSPSAVLEPQIEPQIQVQEVQQNNPEIYQAPVITQEITSFGPPKRGFPKKFGIQWEVC